MRRLVNLDVRAEKIDYAVKKKWRCHFFDGIKGWIMRKLAVVLSTLAALALMGALFFTSVQLVVMNMSFYDVEYRRNDTARRMHTTHSSLMGATDDLLAYIRGEEVDLAETRVQVNGDTQHAFDQNETAHMVDVQQLYQNGWHFRNIAVIVAAICVGLVVWLLPKKERLRTLAHAYNIVVYLFVVVVGGLVGWLAIDFHSFWNAFHHLLFDNMLWLMDSNSSFMVNMLDTQLWIDVCMRVVLYFGGVALALYAASLTYLLVLRQRSRTLLTLDMEDEPPAAPPQQEASPDPKNQKKTRPSSVDAPWHNQEWSHVPKDKGQTKRKTAGNKPPRAPWQQ